jgi:hypothetical protein
MKYQLLSIILNVAVGQNVQSVKIAVGQNGRRPKLPSVKMAVGQKTWNSFGGLNFEHWTKFEEQLAQPC